MSDKTAGLIGMLVLLAILLFLWWWFGLKTAVIVATASAVALTIFGLASSKKS